MVLPRVTPIKRIILFRNQRLSLFISNLKFLAMGKKKKTSVKMALVNQNAAGIDISSRGHHVAVPADRDEHPVRHFGAFTCDLHELAKWLKTCRIDTVALESTGVYWISLFLILEEYGFNVYLVNAKHVKNVSGRKTDVSDCQWIQQLHSCGLLNRSFQPDMFTRSLRSYIRHRKDLIHSSASHIQHIQKSFEQMNIKLHTVIADITGKTGIKMIEAILAGERNPEELIKLVDGRVKASRENIIKSLEGNWKDEHIFTLRHAYELYKFHWEKIRECDKEIENCLLQYLEGEMPAQTIKKKHAKRALSFDVRSYLKLILGVDILEVWGIEESSALEIVSEVGIDMSKWPTEKHFVSWLGLAPNNKISGGKILSSRRPKKKNKAGQGFRMAAYAIQRSQHWLGDFYRRVQARHGAAKATVATARKIAIIFYKMVSNKVRFTPIELDEYKAKFKAKKIKYLERQLAGLGYSMVEN